MPSLISLFCGPGGFDQGFREAGFTTKLAYDNDAAAVATHRRNHPEAGALVADLSIIEAETIIEEWNKRSPHEPPVGVIGGPPCQSFSITNVRQTDDDPRHVLTEHYARLIKHLNRVFQIDFFVFENVPGLLTSKHKDKFERFKMLFQDAGFNIFEESLDAQHFGVPQRRQRIFVVGINKRTRSELHFCFPKGDPFRKNTVAEAIGTLTEPVFFSRLKKGGEDHPNHWCMVPKSRKFTEGIMEPGRYTGRSFRVLRWDEPSYTVAYGHNEVHIHPEGRRRLSVYEAMLLQSFPRNYVLEGSLTEQIRLVSEAVPPPVARVLAESLTDQLRLAVKSVDAYVALLDIQAVRETMMGLTDEQWALLAPLVENLQRPTRRGRPRCDSRLTFNGISLILRTGEKALPKPYPSYQTCLSRLGEWIANGLFERALEVLIEDLGNRGSFDLSKCFIDGGAVITRRGEARWDRLGANEVTSSWQLQTALLCLSPFTLGILCRLKSPVLERLSTRVLDEIDPNNLPLNGLATVLP